jgi:hypothetical protein
MAAGARCASVPVGEMLGVSLVMVIFMALAIII